MVLSTSDMIKILKDKPNIGVLSDATKESKKLKQHITGEDFESLLEQVSGMENEDALKLRKQYARSNKDIFARIHRNEDKIFSAKGGSVLYDLPTTQQKQFVLTLSDVYNGFSIRKWVESFALPYYHIDPMGVIFIEVGDNVAYPTFKSVNSIYDYKLRGRNIEYIIFRTEEKDIYRIVDDNFDYLVQWNGGDSLTTIEGKTYPNYFSKVPALIVSDILKKNSEVFTSPDNEIIEIADEFLRECSVKSIFKLKHGFPKAWQYQSQCPSCKGTGLLEGKDCIKCNGSGRHVTKDTSEVISLPIPNEGQPTIAPNIAGYATPDIQGWDKMTEELTMLENLMHSTYWGIKDKVKAQGVGNEKTATEIIDDMQPVNDRLFGFSKWAESVESFITDMLGEFYYNSSYKGSSINYGRRYMLEGPDVIWLKYEQARGKGSPISVLDDLLIEYYHSKYDNNAIELNKALKLMRVEPFIHMTIGEAKNNVSDFMDYNKKLYFSEWLNQLEMNEVLIKSVKDLKASLDQYVTDKGLKEPEPKQIKI